MNKDDLKLSDAPVNPAKPRSRHQAQSAQDFCYAISEMLDSKRFRWCTDTLEGIYDSVSESGLVTVGQRRAVNNIRSAAGLDEVN